MLMIVRSTEQIKRTDVVVDLGAEEGKKPNPSRAFRIRVDPTKTLSFNVLQQYLQGRTDWSEAVIESLTFFDHLIREWPSSKYTQIKKNFFVCPHCPFHDTLIKD
jgi:eukaryotic translation initiation factor 2C